MENRKNPVKENIRKKTDDFFYCSSALFPESFKNYFFWQVF